MPVVIRLESPLGADLAELMARHEAVNRAETPPESIHMLPPDKLAEPSVSFYVMRDEHGLPVGMGAFKRLSAPGHAEIKSMHVLTERRCQGLAAQMLAHLVAQAQAAGITRLNLETGVEPGFAAARSLYRRAGFVECAPFEGYHVDPNSVFMTRDI